MILDSLEHLRTQAEESAHKTKQARKALQRSKEAEKSRKNDVPNVDHETGLAIDVPPATKVVPTTSTDDDLWANLGSLKPFHVE
jgi:hypothetical protein